MHRAAGEIVVKPVQASEPAVVEELPAAAADGGKVLRWFETDVSTASGEVIARVRKQVYVRLKPRALSSSPAPSPERSRPRRGDS